MQKTTAVSSFSNDFFTGQSGMTGPVLFITGYVLYRLFLQERTTPGSVPSIRNPSVKNPVGLNPDGQSEGPSNSGPGKGLDSIPSIRPNCITLDRSGSVNIMLPRFVSEFEKTPASGKCRDLPPDKALDKMVKNAGKALEEATKKDPTGNYPMWEIGDPSYSISALSFESQTSQFLGSGKTNEDRSLFLRKSGKGTLCAVLDGHGDFKVAEYGEKQLSERFFTVLDGKKENVHAAFEQILFDINQEIFKEPEWVSQGAVLVMSYIEEKTGRIYTLTLGDCEAKIYRKQKDKWGTIPLSCVRDWGCEREQKRLDPILHEGFSQSFQELREEMKINNPKLLRVRRKLGNCYKSINVSRALGDGYYSSGLSHPVISGKGKITLQQLERGDVLILGSDGLWDFIKEQDIYRRLESPPIGNQTLSEIFNIARMQGSQDDITVIKVDIK